MNLAATKAVCFDFDGTLVDNFGAIAATINHLRSAQNIEPLELGEVNRFVGRGIDHLVANTVPKGDVAANIAAYRVYFPTVMRQGTALLPGAAEALAHLHGSGKKLALCSNKLSQFSRDLLDYLHIARYFSAVLGPEDVGAPKPDPIMLLWAMQTLGVSPSETLYVGDMVVDIQTARAAGVCVWVVPTGTEERATLESAKPDRIIDGLRDLLA